MMGHNYECDSCDFEFCSGWSHHAGGQFLVCPSCASQYILGDGQSEWGPRDGEKLRLIELCVDTYQPTQMSSVIHILPRADEEEWDGVVRLDVGDLRCPKCEPHEKLIQEFNENAECPQCHDGKIERHGSCIY